MNPEHISWLYIPTAILLGALHGLEPGHSKTMMAAFIIAIRGTIAQAVLLGVSAAISHSLIIWALAAGALYFGSQWSAEAIEPYLQIASAVLVLAMAVWMFFRTRREVREAYAHSHHHHHHGHGHGHGHDHGHHHHHHHHHHGDHSTHAHAHVHDHGHGEVKWINTGHGRYGIEIHEDGVPPVFRMRVPSGARLPAASQVALATIREGGVRESFALRQQGDWLESEQHIREPHEFEVEMSLSHGDHSHTYRVAFREGGEDEPPASDEEYQDAHEREHADEIRRRFEGRTVTTPQIALFGITGGLMPCPAAFSVLLICLQLKKFTLGFAMVAAFSTGLALTMVATGVLAAWSLRHAEKRFKGFGELMRRAPYVSCAVMVVIAGFMAWHGWEGLQRLGSAAVVR
ncbi:sulfite exporter TauE/SafE family protein [Verrucomicrobium spinosum]|uniref:HoxN/HupN/NixA family nickel/cobalt transporter n=1 Tax=Verrucomicrobium spinosum TaxID=2736 RepID=UPI00017449F1|nr:sulfite exporter TauE/SafE family protein [Verrucomicrobium spinosum]